MKHLNHLYRYSGLKRKFTLLEKMYPFSAGRIPLCMWQSELFQASHHKNKYEKHICDPVGNTSCKSKPTTNPVFLTIKFM